MARTFEVAIDVTYTAYVEVEAEDWEEAMDIAEQRYYEAEYDEKINDAISDGVSDHEIKVIAPF